MGRLTPSSLPSSEARSKDQHHKRGERLKSRTANSILSRCQSPARRLALSARTLSGGEPRPCSSFRGRSGAEEHILRIDPSSPFSCLQLVRFIALLLSSSVLVSLG